MAEENEQVAQEQEAPQIPKKKRYQKSLKKKVVEIEDSEGKVEQIEIREMVQGEKERWQTEMRRRISVGKDGKPLGITDFVDYAGNLLFRCAFNVTTGKPMTIADFRALPTTTVEGMYQDAAEINGFEKDEVQDTTGKKD